MLCWPLSSPGSADRRDSWTELALDSFVSFRRCCNQSVPLCLLAGKFAPPTDRFRFFPYHSLGRLFVEAPPLQLPEQALALHFFLQDAKCLVDIVVANKDLQILHSVAGS